MTSGTIARLLPEDTKYFEDREIEYQVTEESGMTCIVLPAWPLPDGLDHAKVDLLIRLASGYPDVAPDMWWVDPPLHRSDGAEITATQLMEAHLGRQWQRWSRHLPSGQWISGVDRLEAYLARIAREFQTAGGASG